MRIGVIGAGTMGRHHVRILAHNRDVDFVGFYDPDSDQCRRLCDQFGCTSFTESDPLIDRVDAVVIAAPTHLHGAIGLACLQRNVHVLMEKPLAESVAAAELLVRTASERGLVLAVGHVERHNPAIVTLIQKLKERDEPIVSVDCRRLMPFDGTRCMDADVLHDLMIHDIDLVLEIADSPIVRVTAAGRKVFSSRTDVAHATILFENGTIAQLWTGKCSAKKVRTLTVATESRHLEADTLARSLCVFTANRLPAGDQGVCFMGDILSEDHVLADEEPLHREIEDFIEAVRSGAGPTVDGARGLLALRAIAMVEEALATGMVSVGEPR